MTKKKQDELLTSDEQSPINEDTSNDLLTEIMPESNDDSVNG